MLEIEEAENIFRQLNTMYEMLKLVGTTPEQRKQLVRGMVKLKVAINTVQGLYQS